MIKQSDLALAAWKATERTLDAVVTINKIDYKTTDIASISYDAGGYTGDTFGIGSNYENSVTIKFSHLIEGLKPGMTVWPKIGIKTSNGYEYSSLGLFIVSDDIQMDRNNDETTIKAYDQMCLLEGTYTSKLTYPAKMTSVIAEIANLAGVLLNTTDISRLPVQVNLPSAITGQTYRNAIGMIAQFYAGFATFDRDGKLTIRTITEPDYTLDPSQYEQGGLTKNEAPYKIGGIQCEVTTTTTDSTGQSTETTNTLQVGATSGSQIKLTNNLMTMDRLASIWQQLQSLTFYPFSLNWFGNPAIEAGDWLTLQDTKSNKFNVPNNGYTMTFDGSLSAVSKADQASTSSSSYAWRGELSQYVADLGGRQGASGNYIYGTDTTEPPYGAKFNDIWYKQNGNKIELWTYERQADGTGKWVLTVSDSTGEEVKAKVDQVELEAKASTDAAKAASDKADQLSAKYDDTNALANQALGQAVSAQGDASSAVAAANSTASEFGPVKQSADSALSAALSAQENASSAVSQASSAASDSKDAKQIAGAVSQSYKTLTDGSTMTIAELESGLAAKLTKSDLNGYATQTWTQNQIKMTADGINGTISSIKSTVDGHTTSINDLKADSSSFKAQFTTVNNTLGKQTTDIGTLQSTSKELSSGFNTLTSDNTTNKNDISQLKQSATEVSSTLETIQTQVQNSAVGINLLQGTGSASGDVSGGGGILANGAFNGYDAVKTNTAWNERFINLKSALGRTNAKAGDWYTISVYVKSDKQIDTGSLDVYRALGNVDANTNDGFLDGVHMQDKPITTQWQQYAWSFQINDISLQREVTRVEYGEDTGDNWIYWAGWKLEKGNLATDWCPNPADNATVTAVSQLSQTVDGIQTDISKKIEQKDLNGYATETWAQNKINATADGINGTISSIKGTVDSHTTSINTLQTDSNGFKTQFDTVTKTLEKQSTDIGTLQTSSKSLSANFDSLSSDNKTNQHDIGQLQVSAKEFNSTLLTVKTQVQTSAVGTNLLTGTAKIEFQVLGNNGGTQTIQKYDDATNYIQHTSDTPINSMGPWWSWAPEVGEVYTLSADVCGNGYIEGGLFRYEGGDNGSLGIVNLTDNWQRVSNTFRVNAITGNWIIYSNNSTLLKIKHIKIEKGSLATDWCANPADNATVSAVSSISQTIDSIQTTVSGKVDNETYRSKVDQLSNQITSVVGKVDTFGIRNFVTNSQFQYDYLDGASWTGGTTDTWYKDDFAWSRVNGYQGICINQPIGTDSWPSLDSRKIVIGQDISTPWSASAYVNVDTVGVNAIFGIGFFDTKGVRIGFKESYKTSHGLELMKVENAVPPAGTETVDIYFIAHGGGHVAMICPMLNQGTTAAAYVPDNASWSEFQQTASDINLKVSKNGVINAVNVSTEGIQIYGDKLHITATTYIDDAIIKDAMIESINAEKIKVGTLDATKVNIIKLNANNITTGTINGSNLSINLNTGNVEFQAGRIHSSDNTIDININSGYMSVANGSNRVMLKDGEMQFVEPGTYDTSSNPYLRISNTFGGQSTEGAAFIGRKYAVLANSDNLTGSGIFDITMGTETFSGFATGYGSGFLNKGWHMTKIGGADRGVVISGGKATSYRQYWSASPSIMVGATQTSTNSGGMYGSNIIMDCNYLYNFSTWVRTSSHAANVYVADDGAIVRASSASKYKTNIERSFDTGMGERILEIPTAHWFDKAEVRKKTLDPQAPDPRRYFGMIADDLDDAGLTELVEYDEKGEVEGIMYDRVALTIIPIVRNYRDRITKLESEVKQLKEG
ncbi:gp58-like family protein [Lactiplantibacillus plantarum]|uniref:gp58-like family protein n=1 Tax=Lactiplantibacillus plantarum TaxID=1590 RepID=UPI000C1A1432|nr:gp58-like family protein [Lactiplantibacillus plantarum]PKX76394.1 hypothetical protein CUR47_13405 [Lactiplantibacillus plantarum]